MWRLYPCHSSGFIRLIDVMCFLVIKKHCLYCPSARMVWLEVIMLGPLQVIMLFLWDILSIFWSHWSPRSNSHGSPLGFIDVWEWRKWLGEMTESVQPGQEQIHTVHWTINRSCSYDRQLLITLIHMRKALDLRPFHVKRSGDSSCEWVYNTFLSVPHYFQKSVNHLHSWN